MLRSTPCSLSFSSVNEMLTAAASWPGSLVFVLQRSTTSSCSRSSLLSCSSRAIFSLSKIQITINLQWFWNLNICRLPRVAWILSAHFSYLISKLISNFEIEKMSMQNLLRWDYILTWGYLIEKIIPFFTHRELLLMAERTHRPALTEVKVDMKDDVAKLRRR